MPNRHRTAVIIGGGHNGLVCACYLAAAGIAVRLLESQPRVGGAAITEEFHPGFRNSVASYTVSLLHPLIVKDLDLKRHGLRIINRPISNYLPLPDGDSLLLYPDTGLSRAEVARHSRADADRLGDYYGMLDSIIPLFKALMLETPPRLVGAGITDLFDGLRLAAKLRGLSLQQQRTLHNLLTRSAGEILDSWFESSPIKALFGFDAVVGNFVSPYEKGSAYVLLHHLLGESNGIQGAWGHAVGGMGAISEAMSDRALELGVEIECEQAVRSINIHEGQVQGVTLDSGRILSSDLVVSAINPRPTFLDLIDSCHLEESFLEQIRMYTCVSGSFRINVALGSLPQFTTSRDLPLEAASAGIIMAPSLEYMDQAYLQARNVGFSQEPIIEMLIPSTLDDSLAPPGQHVASLFCQHFDPRATGHWDENKEQAADRIIEVVNRYAPGFKQSIIARQVLSPLDLERRFGMISGDIFHGRLSLDQLYAARPVLGAGDYRAPIRNLYLCGSGTHPGGGVSGLPGHNAAREIIKDQKRFF